MQEENRDANLFSGAREKAENAQPGAPASADTEDPFDTIFRIFNSK